MVRKLSLSVDEMTDGMLTQVVVDRDRLERAKQNLVQRVDLFGIQEQFGAFCEGLEQRYGWTLGPMHVANQTEPIEAPDSLRRAIAADNEMDAELYRFATEHWERSTGTASLA